MPVSDAAPSSASSTASPPPRGHSSASHPSLLCSCFSLLLLLCFCFLPLLLPLCFLLLFCCAVAAAFGPLLPLHLLSLTLFLSARLLHCLLLPPPLLPPLLLLSHFRDLYAKRLMQQNLIHMPNAGSLTDSGYHCMQRRVNKSVPRG